MLNKYTPIKCYKTKAPLKIGDRVMDFKGCCGTLEWDDYLNIYFIRPPSGFGKIKTQNYIKINDFFDFKIDTTKVECRKKPHKKKW